MAFIFTPKCQIMKGQTMANVDEVLELIAQGTSYHNIASKLGTHLDTIKRIAKANGVWTGERRNDSAAKSAKPIDSSAPKGAAVKIAGEWHKLNERDFVMVYHLGEWIRCGKTVEDYRKAVKSAYRKAIA